MSSEEYPSPRRSIVPVSSASKEEDMAADAQGSEACQNQTEELDARYHDAVRGSPLPNKVRCADPMDREEPDNNLARCHRNAKQRDRFSSHPQRWGYR